MPQPRILASRLETFEHGVAEIYYFYWGRIVEVWGWSKGVGVRRRGGGLEVEMKTEAGVELREMDVVVCTV